MTKEEEKVWLAEKRELEMVYRQELEQLDLELIKTRATLVRVINLLSGRDGEVDVGEAISVCQEALELTQRVIGRNPKSSTSAAK